jgi:hypothetical protein
VADFFSELVTLWSERNDEWTSLERGESILKPGSPDLGDGGSPPRTPPASGARPGHHRLDKTFAAVKDAGVKYCRQAACR